MYERRIVRERKQGYGAVRRIRDAAQVYEAFKQDFTQLDREMFVIVLLDGSSLLLDCGSRLADGSVGAVQVSTLFGRAPSSLLVTWRGIRSGAQWVTRGWAAPIA
jgi:hypothetical protein